MKLETFFEKFGQFADAPDAVAKMRELVLQLAVRGKLVSQDSTDEPADALLVSIRNTKHRPANGKAIKKQAPVPVSDEEIPFSVPRSWAWTRLGEIGEWGSGSTPSRGDHSLFGGGITWLKSGELNDNHELERSEETLSDLALRNGSFRRNQVGDVLLAMYGATLGKAAILAGPAVTNQAVCGCTPFDGACNRYLFYFLISQRANFCAASEGGAQPNISKVKIIWTPFPLPPLAEQKRIIAKIDELMALCDRLEAQQKERETRHTALNRAAIARFDDAPTPANLNFLFHPSYSVTPSDLRKTILDLAVRGKLVTQDPRDEQAEILFGRIQGERHRYAESHGIRVNESKKEEKTVFPFKIPVPWKWTSLSSVFNVVTDGDHLPPPKADSGIAFLTIGNITTGRLDFSSTRFVPDQYYRALAEFRRPVIGDILYTVVGATYGRPALVDTTQPFCIQRHIALFRPAPSMDVDFLLLLLKSPLVYEQAAASTTGTAQPTVPLGALRSFRVPLPPLSEQKRIAAKASQLMTLADRLEMQLAESEKTAKELLEAAIHELLHPTADVIEFLRIDSDRASERAAIGCYVIEHLLRNPSFGHTMNMKVVYMAQAHIGLPLDLKFERQAAGPWHSWIEEFDTMGQSEGWFTVTQKSIGGGHTKYEYAPKAALKQKVAEAAAVLGEHRAEFDRLLGLFADLNTEKAEIVATLFAAWNDFLIDGKTPTDDEIIREVRENWNVSKQRFTPERLATWLKWLRKNRLVPQGCGPRTQQQLFLALN